MIEQDGLFEQPQTTILKNGAYTLELSPSEVWFMYDGADGRNPSPITYRSVAKYTQRTQFTWQTVERIISEQLQLVEVGAGLSELVPMLTTYGLKPMVIDPANYGAIAALIQTALTETDLGLHHAELLTELQERTVIYRDPERVTLINATIEEAWQTMGDRLRRSADVVFDCCGASLWALDLRGIRSIEDQIRKDSGELYIVG